MSAQPQRYCGLIRAITNDHYSLSTMVGSTIAIFESVISRSTRVSLKESLLPNITDNYVVEPLTFLTSRRNGLLNVYDVSKDSDSLLHLNTPAYTLPSIPILGSARTGFSWLQYPNDQYRACLLQLSNRGSLHRIDVELCTSSANANVDRYTDRGCDWSEAVQQLEKDVESQQEDTGPTGERGYEETDLIDVYAGMFPVCGLHTYINYVYGFTALFCEDVLDDDNSTAAYDLLETMPVFWQKQEEPIEHILTA